MEEKKKKVPSITGARKIGELQAKEWNWNITLHHIEN